MVSLTIQTQDKEPKMDAEAANAATQQNKNNEDVEDDPKILMRRLRVKEATIHMLRFHLILLLLILIASVGFSMYFQRNYVCKGSKTADLDATIASDIKEQKAMIRGFQGKTIVEVFNFAVLEKLFTGPTDAEIDQMTNLPVQERAIRHYSLMRRKLIDLLREYIVQTKRADDFETANLALMGSLLNLYKYCKHRTETCNLNVIDELEVFLPNRSLHFVDRDALSPSEESIVSQILPVLEIEEIEN